MRPLALAAPILALGLTACSSALVSQDLRDLPGGKPGDPVAVNGLPYRAPRHFVVEVYRKTDDGYALAGQTVANLADPTRLYALNLDGQALSNANVKFEMRADSTLSTVHMTDESHAVSTLGAVGTGAAALETQNQALRAARRARANEPEQALETLTDLTYQARIAQQKLEEAQVANKPMSDQLAAEQAAVSAKLKANAAAAKYGAAKPFPEL